MQLAPAEEKMWKSQSKKHTSEVTDDWINTKYESGDRTILTKMNREKLPIFMEALEKPDYIDLQSFYQRRSRWDKKKQSQLIESFLINVPVPPIILYEKSYTSYEVIDGQQRITAIKEFYQNQLKLTQLEILSTLNGSTYNTLPLKFREQLNRRSIASIILLPDSKLDTEEELFLKQITFKRLNTGGVALSQQEVRNCVYYGKFNQLLLELTRNSIFAQAWKIPIDRPDKLMQNNFYRNMEDAELVLRFFALRHAEDFRGSMEEFFDSYMMKSLKFSDADIQVLREIFLKTIDLAAKIYGRTLFKPYDSKSDGWKNRAYKAYYDAVMVGISQHLTDTDILLRRKAKVIEHTKKLFQEEKSKLLTGSGRTKAEIIERIRLFDNMLSQVIAD